MTTREPAILLLKELAKVIQWDHGHNMPVPLDLAQLKVFIAETFVEYDVPHVLEILGINITYLEEDLGMNQIENFGEDYRPLVEEFMADVIRDLL